MGTVRWYVLGGAVLAMFVQSPSGVSTALPAAPVTVPHSDYFNYPLPTWEPNCLGFGSQWRLCNGTVLRACSSGAVWLHEIKHDGFRVIARKAGERVKLYSRPGNDLTWRFPLIVEALARLRSRSCIIDGEAVACGEDGIASFDRIRYRRHDAEVFMWAFDLIELNGDLRRDPLNVRKATLASVLARAAPGLRLNEHLEADGPDVFHHACMLGLEGIASKRKDSQYRSGPSPHWIKSKNPKALAVKREAEEDWGR